MRSTPDSGLAGAERREGVPHDPDRPEGALHGGDGREGAPHNADHPQSARLNADHPESASHHPDPRDGHLHDTDHRREDAVRGVWRATRLAHGPKEQRDSSVEALFLSSVRRFAGPVRGVGVVVISAFGLLAVPDDQLPLGVTLFAVMLAGAAVDCWSGLSGRAAPLSLAFVAVRVVAVFATQPWTGGPTNLWALNILTTTAITLQWEWPPHVAVSVTAGLLASALGVGGFGGAEVLVPRLVFESALAQLGFVLLRRSCRRVDELTARRSALARAEAVSYARHRQEREYLALLHDTAASTFLMVAVDGQHAEPARVAEYARHDLAVLTGAAGGPAAQDSPVDLTTSLRAVVARGPLAVACQWRDEPVVPASVALALVRAVREALVNVERHAGVAEATVSVRGAGDGVVVVVADAGAGFDPGAVPAARRGLRGSVVERMAAVGGSATLTSSPGAGTTVRLEWPGG